MIENIILAFQGIWSHKMRSFLTMLGIIIGIASIIAIVSTIKGTNEQIKSNLIGSGNNAVEVQLYNGDWPFEMAYETLPDGIPVISEDTRQELLALDEVKAVAFYSRRQEYDAVYYLNNSINGGEVLGIDQQYLGIEGYRIKTGRGFSQTDYDNYNKVTLLDAASATSLFQDESPLGKTIEIKGEPFIVIGIVEQASSFEPVINSLDEYFTYNQNSAGKIFLPSTIWPIIYRYDEPQAVVIQAASTEDMTAAGKKATDIINSYLYNSNQDTVKYKAQDQLQQAKDLQALSSATSQQLIWIASISLLVGGIGVMNIMLVSVTERTREIGLKKAIGARKRRILAQFLTEAAVLTSFGGLLGVICGVGFAYLVSRITSAPSAISIPAAIVAVVFSVFIGVVFGLIPAVKAANLNPIEALRHE